MNKTSYSLISLSVAAILIWFFAVYSPSYKKLLEVETEKNEISAQITDFKRTLTQLPVFLERRKDLKQEKNDVISKLYTKDEVISLFDSLQILAVENNLYIQEITPPLEELLELNNIMPDSSQPQFLNIKLVLKGDYLNFGHYAERIEDSPFFRGVNSCNMIANKEKDEPLRIYLGFKALLGQFRRNS